MNARERLQSVLDHKPVDRLCVDFGAGGQTGIDKRVLAEDKEAIDSYLGRVMPFMDKSSN